MEGGTSVYQVVIYSDANGHEPVTEYMRELAQSNSKDSRIRLNKIGQYIKVLQEYGTRAGEPYMKHIDGNLWELRPISDRIFFGACVNGVFVLLHGFPKKSQKTPEREKQKARNELEDYLKRVKG